MSLDFKVRLQSLRNYFQHLIPCKLKDDIMKNLDIIEAMPDDEDKDKGIKQIEDYIESLDI